MMISRDGATFALPRPELHALARAMSRDKSRPNLAAVWLDGKNRRAYSCDGHRLLVGTADGGQYDKNGRAKGLGHDHVAALLKASRKADTIAVTFEGDAATCKVYDGRKGAPRADNGLPTDETFSAVFKTVDASAPPLKGMIPAYEKRPPQPSPAIAVNPRYLAGLADLAAIGGDRTLPVVWYHAGELDPTLAVYRQDGGTVWRCVIMPMKNPG